MTSHVDVSVVIPTLGREAMLRRCLESLAATDPLPAEVLVVDQSEGSASAAVEGIVGLDVRVIPCPGRGISRGLNLGLREAAYEDVLVTHDDCTVAADWVAVGHRELRAVPGGIVTGRVLPVGDPEHVPSTKVDTEPHDFTGECVINGLYGNNVGLPRDAVLAIGGFDERGGFRRPSETFAAEDNDLCFRWLREGRTLRYVPELVVDHHDWRTEEQLVKHYRLYAKSDGMLYAKHILRREWAIVPFMLREVYWGFKGQAGGIVRRRPAWKDPRRAILTSLPIGLALGIREELRIRRTCAARHP